MGASMDRTGLRETRFRLAASRADGVASDPVFPQVMTGFPSGSQEGNRKPVDPGEQRGQL